MKLLLVILIIVIAVAIPFTCHETRKIGEILTGSFEKPLHAVGEIAEKFKQGSIQFTFSDHISRIEGNAGDILEVCTMTTTEYLYKSDSLSTVWGLVNLGTTVSEIEVPVTYRFHIKLSDHWSIEQQDNVCLVHAPEIKPSLPPAIHIDGLRKRSASGWARFDADDQLSKLEKSLTPYLNARARERIPLIQEKAEVAVANFVRAWLLKEEQWSKDRFSVIKVYFPVDYVGDGNERGYTLTLEEKPQQTAPQ